MTGRSNRLLAADPAEFDTQLGGMRLAREKDDPPEVFVRVAAQHAAEVRAHENAHDAARGR